MLLCALGALSACEKPRQPAPGQPALRIVALSPALAIIIRDLGFESQIVGRHAYDLVLDPSIPSCGELGTIDYEALLKTNPTHIFIQWGAQELPPRLLELAKEHNWVVQNLNPLSLDQIEEAANSIDKSLFAFSTGDPAEHPTPPPPFEDEMRRAWSDRGPAMKSAGKILLVSGTKPIGALGPGSFHQQLLQRLGATAVPQSGGPWITLDTEDLAHLAPDGIIIFAPRPPRSPAPAPATPDQLIALFGRAGELDIPAFKNKHVALIDDPLSLTPSTAMIPVADEIARILSDWAKNPSPPARAN